jgi:hypothetical protein
MRTCWKLLPALAVAFAVAVQPAHGDDKGPSFAKYPAPDAAEVKKQAEAWLKASGAKADEKALKAVWDGDRTLLDKVTRTIALGDRDAAKLLREAAEDDAPTAVPELLKDKKKPAFYRNNLALAYARSLALRRVYEEALDVFQSIDAKDVVDPATYFFYRAVCEHELMLEKDARASVERLLDDVAAAPESYRNVAALMNYDMDTWQEKDLDWVARKMENVQRRLALGRGGKQTRRMQREVLVRLEEMIKELEEPRGPRDPRDDDGPRRPGDKVRPPSDVFTPPAIKTPGDVLKRFDGKSSDWLIKLPEKERAKVRAELIRTLPASHRAVVERYFQELDRKAKK